MPKQTGLEMDRHLYWIYLDRIDLDGQLSFDQMKPEEEPQKWIQKFYLGGQLLLKMLKIEKKIIGDLIIIPCIG